MISALDLMPNATVDSTIDAALAHARLGETPVLVTRVAPVSPTADPIAFLAAGAAALGSGMFWSEQRSGATFAGAGSAFRITSWGSGRFDEASGAVRELRQSLYGNDGDLPFPLLGGFAFDPSSERSSRWRAFPDALLSVPQVLLQVHHGRAYLRVTTRVRRGMAARDIVGQLQRLAACGTRWLALAPSHHVAPRTTSSYSFPSEARWESAVAAAITAIHAGHLEKAVLAREERLQMDGEPSPFVALDRLRAADSTATLFAVEAAGAWFIGATPERLVRLQNGRVDVTCLAGSIGIGDSSGDRAELAQRLLARDKDREEHEIVVRSTMDALRAVCADVERAPGTPRVMANRTIQHLATPLTARLPGNGTVLDLVEVLHPTPAVGGQPTDRALALIRQLEAIDRGWYAGPIGWADIDGSGEFAVAIRSALLTGNSASVFAGCGIVAGSSPEDEFAETQLKLRPMLAALGAA